MPEAVKRCEKMNNQYSMISSMMDKEKEPNHVPVKDRIMGLSINDSVYSCLFFFLTVFFCNCSFSERFSESSAESLKLHWICTAVKEKPRKKSDARTV